MLIKIIIIDVERTAGRPICTFGDLFSPKDTRSAGGNANLLNKNFTQEEIFCHHSVTFD